MLTPAGSGSSPPRPIRREIRRFAASICLPHETRGYLPGLGDKGRAAVGRAGSFNSGKNVTRNRYFRSEGLKGREPEGTLFFWIEQSGGSARVKSDPVPEPMFGRQRNSNESIPARGS